MHCELGGGGGVLTGSWIEPSGIKEDSIPYVGQVILTYVPVKGEIVNPNIDGFLYCPGKQNNNNNNLFI